jgi:hypothetical protein
MKEKMEVLSIAIAFLMLIPTLPVVPSQPGPGSASDLLKLPAEPYGENQPYKLVDSTKQLVSLSSQSLDALPDQTVSFRLTYKCASPTNPNEIDQLYFVESWTPSWPPSGYTITVYNGIPGTSPRVTDNKTVSFTAPSQSGTYFLWFCFGAQQNMQDAINERTISMNGLPAHVKVVVTNSNPSPSPNAVNSPINLWLPLGIIGIGIVASATVFAALHYRNKSPKSKETDVPVKESMSKEHMSVQIAEDSLLLAGPKFWGKCETCLE